MAISWGSKRRALAAAGDFGRFFAGDLDELQKRWGLAAVEFNDGTWGVVAGASPARTRALACSASRAATASSAARTNGLVVAIERQRRAAHLPVVTSARGAEMGRAARTRARAARSSCAT